MHPALIPVLLETGSKLIDRWFPDPKEAEERKKELLQLQQSGELAEMAAAKELALAQIDVNKEEAKHSSLLVAGWRPAIGWVCAASLAIYYIPRFTIGMFVWAHSAWGQETMPPLPEMGIMDILGLVGTLLGSSLIRMREKERNVARDSL